MPKLNLKGQRFGKLIVVEPALNKGKLTSWKCKCDCGNEAIVYTNNLRRGHTTSCGCFKFATRNKTHGYRKTRLYKVWCDIKTRCYNPNNFDYPRYGGRGITMCNEWKDDFVAFHDWAIDTGYDKNAPRGQCTLDRIDVNGNYCPENCRWIDIEQQQNNRRDNVLIEYNGEIKTMAQWSKYLNLSYEMIRQRIQLYGWSVERAFTEPPRHSGRNKHY